jgi:XisI protein
MDKLKKFRNALLEIMGEYTLEEGQRPNNKGVEFKKIIDDKQHQYQFIQMGWDGLTRVYDLIFHADIREGKIWIQEDSLEESLAERLEEKGVLKRDIVLAYLPEGHRVFTSYAAA